MLSRRNIRVKVMQTLYALDSLKDGLKPGEPDRMLSKKMEQSRKLFTYLLYFVTEVARYAEKDAAKKAGKHLPTAEDLAVNTRIAGNELVWKIIENSSFHSAVENMGLAEMLDRDLLRKTYSKLVAAPEYQDYIELPSREKKSERKILEFIFNELMLPDENFVGHLEENFINWDDDAEMMHSLVLNFLNKPSGDPFTEIVSAEKMDFAKKLLQTVLDKSDHTLELIKPKLKNWDADRIASLDLVLLQMGVCEFLYFETIPTRVTINEYIDLAKAYSTEQSGQFINGLLDNIHKELTAQGKIDKRNYKNSTL